MIKYDGKKSYFDERVPEKRIKVTVITKSIDTNTAILFLSSDCVRPNPFELDSRLYVKRQPLVIARRDRGLSDGAKNRRKTNLDRKLAINRENKLLLTSDNRTIY